ncbi:hypothetical protein MIV003L [Invertebrate iridescent virus 3]|uniref:Uncharacterized protein 003L n=1 Tax=Invertebrate iridescent virus 3 TaxID=345201 RepID=003L_IIV3|nr:hypothetical protein MIV003L [Invertebrate iridescent virus 3]Q197F7.1 RecName: Full=Uncharacterized protein 003L [Invertebrate iridescent virus 3]ABF82033.1 hypothetical protein MIV003L [Invertebrate iridescent virus 3]
MYQAINPCPQSWYGSPQLEREIVCKMSGAPHYPNYYPVHPNALGGAWFDTSLNARSLTTTPSLTTCTPPSLAACTPPTSLGMVDSPPHINPPRRIGTLCFDFGSAKSPQRCECVASDRPSTTSNTAPDTYRLLITNSKTRKNNYGTCRLEPLTYGI